MKFNDLIRVAIVLATLGYLFGGEDGPRPPKPEPCVVVPVEPYVGSMTSLHKLSAVMLKNRTASGSVMLSPLAATWLRQTVAA